MSSPANLTQRQQHILWATIQHYVATAEPVASKTLMQEYGFKVSSATIRNAMSWLEKAGLLYQPHTSAGRVPSDSGYRIYVDKLIQPDETISTKVEKLLTRELNWDTWSLEAVLQGAAKILVTLSGYIALITVPSNPTQHTLRHLQLVQIDKTQVMLIVVTDIYETQSILMDLSSQEGEVEEDEGEVARQLQILSNFLNSKLKGRSLGEISQLDWGELDREFASYGSFLQNIQTELGKRTQVANSGQMMIRGFSEVLRQPEFSQLQQVQTLIHLLEEEQEQLLPLIFEFPELDITPKVTVRIGSENPLEPMQSCALVSAIYHQGETPVGSVAVIGPTRMLYENAIAIVEATADYLSESLS